MSNRTFKLGLILASLAAILFFNYPSFDKFFLTDETKIQNQISDKHKEALTLIEELQNLNLALPDTANNSIRLLLDDRQKGVNLENVSIRKILKDYFEPVQNADYYQLKQVKFGDDIFLSDFVTQINNLLENVRRIDDIKISEDKQSLIFAMAEGKRLSLSSPPLDSLFSDASYSWVYDYDSQAYQAQIADPPNLLNLGLDLVGGVYLDVGVDQTKLLANFIERRVESLQSALYELGFDHDSVESEAPSNIVIKSEASPSFPEFVDELSSFIDGFDYSILSDQKTVLLTLEEEYVEELKESSLRQVIEVIRNRIDLLGVKEPIIQRRGQESVVVQVPGQTDSLRIKELITRPANLEFRLVLQDPNALENGVGEALIFETVDQTTKEVINQELVTVAKEVLMTGDLVSDARVVFEQFSGAPQVSMILKPEGADIFSRITSENVGGNLAIILDNKIKSYPSINQVIYGGEASISGRFSLEEATDLAIVLRSGALPVSLNVNEEKVIGATLGEESIKKSVYSLAFGFLGIGIFMLVYYAFSGLIATLVLSTNLLMVLAILAFFGATLTLPGVAGIILTVGMAVDANILIFERIREELNKKAGPKIAIKQGFSRAAVAIMDSNFTTLMVAAVLFQFGTGPIRGFAITLAVGIVTTLFTSLVFSKWLYDVVYLSKSNLKKISI